MFFPTDVILIGYYSYDVNVLSSNHCAGLSPRIKISFPVLSKCTDELISAPKIMIFLPMLQAGTENSERVSNPMSKLLYFYLSESTFLVGLTDQNKQLPNVKSVFGFPNCGPSM